VSGHDEIPALGALRENLRAAAARETAPAPRRRRVRRGGLIAVVAGLSVAGAATGAALLSTGSPVEELPGKGAQYAAPGGTRLSPVLIAEDPTEGELAWGVGVYTARNGDECVLGGRVRGQAIGVLEGGSFRPYASDYAGSCGDFDHHTATVSEIKTGGEHPRTLIYGRARPDVRSVTLTLDGRPHRTVPGHSGAFLFLFEGDVQGEALVYERSKKG
jgi:hypothetical protein